MIDLSVHRCALKRQAARKLVQKTTHANLEVLLQGGRASGAILAGLHWRGEGSSVIVSWHDYSSPAFGGIHTTNNFSVFTCRGANQLVEEYMLLANISVATAIASAFPDCALLRRHPQPNARKLAAAASAAKDAGGLQ